MLQIANASYSPIVQSLQMPQKSTVCLHHVANHFVNASKSSLISRVSALIEKTKTIFGSLSESDQESIISNFDDIMRLAEHIEPDEEPEKELHDRRLDQDKDKKSKKLTDLENELAQTKKELGANDQNPQELTKDDTITRIINHMNIDGIKNRVAHRIALDSFSHEDLRMMEIGLVNKDAKQIRKANYSVLRFGK